MATVTVRSLIKFDPTEAELIHSALHSQGTLAALDAVRAKLSEPLTVAPQGNGKRTTSLTSRVRAGAEIDGDLIGDIRTAITQRRALLANLQALVGDPDGKLQDLIECHDQAAVTVETIRDQMDHTAAGTAVDARIAPATAPTPVDDHQGTGHHG